MTTRFRRGGNAIEFALLLPVFIALLAGIFEFGWMFFMRSTVIRAVQHGCRAGAVIPPTDLPSPQDVAKAAMANYLSTFDIACRSEDDRCEATVEADGESPYETLQCKLVMAYDPITGLVPAPEQLSSTSVVLFELQQ